MMANYKDFTDDIEKMKDFKLLTKAKFLSSYSYLTEEEYDLTEHIDFLKQQEHDELWKSWQEFYNKYKDE
jgi:hypothetical protein